MGGNDKKNIHQLVMEKIEKDGPRIALEWQKEYERNRALLEKRKRAEADQAEVGSEVITKKCTKCGEVKALDAFSADKRAKDGKQCTCKGCRRKYYQENKEPAIAKMRKYYEENKSKRAEYRQKYYQENKEIVKERSRNYRQENKERIQKYLQGNKDRISARQRKYRQENKEKRADYERKYRQENPEVHRRKNHKRRALLRNLPHAPLTPAQYERLYEFRDQVFGEVMS